MMAFEQTVDFLFNLRNRGSKLGLSRMERFADAAGNPEREFPAIHIAGTNGKGSVCALLESALRAGGYRTGLYTSPHLVNLGERIQVNRRILAEDQIVSMAGELRQIAGRFADEGEEDYPSFFEFMTLMAFRCFAAAEVDCGILEVGLGGRLDATNIVLPEVTAITSIGLDHTEILGDTYEKIAAEKAGILKEGVPVVIGRLPGEAERVIRSRARNLGCEIFSVAHRFAEGELPETNLAGDFQRWNAGVAEVILEVLRPRFPIEAETVRGAFRNVHWAGRWEEIEVGGRKIILDSTHNPEGAEELRKNLLATFGTPEGRLTVVVGSLGRDRAAAVLRVVAPYAHRLLLIKPSQPRALSFREMRDLVPLGFDGEVIESGVEECFPGGNKCALPYSGEPVLLTGSLYLLGEVMTRIQANSGSTGSLQDRI